MAASRRMASGSGSVVCVLVAVFVTSGLGKDRSVVALDSCDGALGMESGHIPDSAISASSSFDEYSVGPLNSRIRTERNGGAWCPKEQISKDVYEYLEIDLGRVKVVTVVETQGRFGNGQGLEYAPHFMLEYQRQPTDKWREYRDHHGERVLEGNVNTYLAEKRVLQPPIIARKVRFIPYSVRRRTICMRVELHGCRGEGLLSYSMPQGQSRGAEVDLYDLTYDGTVKDDYLSGGLGQLTDGQIGTWNFRLDVQQTGHRGYEWIGWRNDSLNSSPVEIVFHFDEPRNISGITIHCNNLFSKDIRVFRRAEVYTTTDDLNFEGQPVIYDYYRDDVIYHARNVTIPIPHLVAKKVKLALYFDARWMLISEITFHSVPAEAAGNHTFDKETEVIGSEVIKMPTTSARAAMTQSSTTSLRSISTTVANVPLISSVPTGHHDTRGRPLSVQSPPSGHDKQQTREEITKAPPVVSTPIGVRNQPHHHGSMTDTYIGVIIGTLTALILLLAGLGIYFMMRRRQKDYSHTSLKVFATDDLTYVPSAKLANGNVYNAVSTGDMTFKKVTAETRLQNRKLPSPPVSTEVVDNEVNLSRDYASPELTHLSPLVVSLPPSPVYQSTSTPRHQQDGASPLTSSRDRMTSCDVTNIQSWSGNSMYAVPSDDVTMNDDLRVAEFPRHVLKFVEKLGQGQFGEIHLCEVDNLSSFVTEGAVASLDPTGKSSLVAVKMLHRNVNGGVRSEFSEEVKILLRLKDPNIVSVLGVCSQGEPLAVVMEYMKYGDLHQFLSVHVLDTELNQTKKANLLSYGCLIYMVTQIASGMKYLETLNMVHRDLATRNCLIGHLYTVKISDFGMSRSLYSEDYCKIDGKTVLPVRWMAWESVLLGKFSCKSDVWSFGVTLWEVLTFARQRPFGDLSDAQVLDNCAHCYHDDGLQLFLPQPPNCPKEIYDLMIECCHRDETMRPTFKEIHMFLSRKNMGYDPRDEKPMRYALGYIKSL